MAKKKTKNFKQDLFEKLQDPKFALEYIKSALEERDMPEVFLLALRDVAEAKGMSKLAKASKLNRENLYRMLSKKGNPAFVSLQSILNALGLKISVELQKASWT